MPTLSKQQVQTILDNAPQDADKMEILSGLVKRGYEMEGVDSNAAQQYVQQREAAKMKSEQSTVMKDSENLGTGFDPSREYTGDESFLGATGKTLMNAPKSAFQFTKNIVSAVSHPLRTLKSLRDIVGGGAARVVETGLEDTQFGQHLLEIQNQKRVAAGMQPFEKDANGKYQIPETPELQQFKRVGAFLNDRYGSVDKFKESLVEDPVGVVGDIAGVLTGAGAGLRATGMAGELANTLSKVGTVTEPISAISRGVSKVSEVVGGTKAAQIAKDVIPGATRIQQNQITKALDLTQGDLAEITKSTGNNPADFIVKKDIVSGTPDEIAQKLDTIKSEAMATVRDEISKVDRVYKTTDIPAVHDGLVSVLEDIDGVAGLEDIATEVRALANKDTFSLSDVQRAKELLDENSNLYSKFGDVKSSTKARGLANLRAEMRSFIETEVDDFTGGAVDIRALNNDVSTSKAISDKITTRATRDLTRQQLNGFDLLLGVGGTAAFSPLAGVGIVVAKKIMESPTFRLTVARSMKKISDIRMKSIIEQVSTGKLSPANKELLQTIVDEAKKNAVILNPTLSDLEKSTTPPEEQ